MSIYAPERKWPRLVPANAVMVSIYSNGDQAYGLISNISEMGACVVGGVHFEPGGKILLRISFDPEGEPFSTQAEVIWSRDESESEKKATFVHGLKFDMISDEQRNELHKILSRPDFKDPVIPGEAMPRAGIDKMMVDLNDEFDELAKKIDH
jgi:hypothetical protein